MSMDYNEFLTRVIDRGIDGAKRDYSGETTRSKEKREGSIAGFEACRGKSPDELREVLKEARSKVIEKRNSDDLSGYWYLRCFEAEVEWVCNSLSAALQNIGVAPIVPATVHGTLNAAAILKALHGETS